MTEVILIAHRSPHPPQMLLAMSTATGDSGSFISVTGAPTVRIIKSGTSELKLSDMGFNCEWFAL